jgi:hypothetical protein
VTVTPRGGPRIDLDHCAGGGACARTSRCGARRRAGVDVDRPVTA